MHFFDALKASQKRTWLPRCKKRCSLCASTQYSALFSAGGPIVNFTFRRQWPCAYTLSPHYEGDLREPNRGTEPPIRFKMETRQNRTELKRTIIGSVSFHWVSVAMPIVCRKNERYMQCYFSIKTTELLNGGSERTPKQ